MQRRRQIHQEASRQMDSLRQHRAERDAAHQMSQRARIDNFKMHLGDAWEAREQAEGSNTAAAAVVTLHEERWAKVDEAVATASIAHTSFVLTNNNLPWPPFDGDMQRYLKVLAASSAGDGGDLRRAYTRTCLRWHPDKFQQKYGRLVPEKEFPELMEKVHEVSQRLTTAWSQIQAEEGTGQ